VRKSGDVWGCVCVWRVAEYTWGSRNVSEGRKLKIQKERQGKEGKCSSRNADAWISFSKGGFECIG
jgi:hypothetical protein